MTKSEKRLGVRVRRGWESNSEKDRKKVKDRDREEIGSKSEKRMREQQLEKQKKSWGRRQRKKERIGQKEWKRVIAIDRMREK